MVARTHSSLMPLLAVAVMAGVGSAYAAAGVGGVVTRDGAEVYVDKTGDDYELTVPRGTFVAGGTLEHDQVTFGAFERTKTRVRVVIAADDAAATHGWMNAADVAEFSYECSCRAGCSPVKGFKKGWNDCFLRAAGAKLAEVEQAPSPAP